jgi:hypothetical protein
MSDALVIAALVGTLAFIAIVLLTAGIRQPRPGDTEMALLGHAGGEVEKELWVTALRTAVINPHVINSGDFYPTEGGTQPAAYEVWVRARDEHRARGVLGL